jgi:hypothetical protein
MKLIKLVLLFSIFTVILNDNYAVFDPTINFISDEVSDESSDDNIKKEIIFAKNVCKTLTGNNCHHRSDIAHTYLYECNSPIQDTGKWENCRIDKEDGHTVVIAYRSEQKLIPAFHQKVGIYARCSKIIPSGDSITYVSPRGSDAYEIFQKQVGAWGCIP